jgi:hypothetical protein
MPVVHPNDLNRLIDYWRSILSSGESGEIEARLRRFDGQYRWFLFRASPLREETGRINAEPVIPYWQIGNRIPPTPFPGHERNTAGNFCTFNSVLAYGAPSRPAGRHHS